jgi:hypothetical protein
VPHPEPPERRDWPSYTGQALKFVQWPPERRLRFLQTQARLVKLMRDITIGASVLTVAVTAVQVWAFITGHMALGVGAVGASLMTLGCTVLVARWMVRDIALLRRCEELHQRRQRMHN